jgi:hypothetical protein
MSLSTIQVTQLFQVINLGNCETKFFYVEICGLYTSNWQSTLGGKNCAQLPNLRKINPRGVCYQCRNVVFFSKILNFYSTFLNVNKNSIFDWNSRVEEKHLKKLLFSKNTVFIDNIPPWCKMWSQCSVFHSFLSYWGCTIKMYQKWIFKQLTEFHASRILTIQTFEKVT